MGEPVLRRIYPRLLLDDEAPFEPVTDITPDWIPTETWLPAAVRGYERGAEVMWIGNRVVEFLEDRALLPGDVLKIDGQSFLWAGSETRIEARVRFNAVILQLPKPDGALCIASVECLKIAIRDFLPVQPETV